MKTIRFVCVWRRRWWRENFAIFGLAENDLVRYYTLCRACEDKIEFTGGSPPQEEKDHLIV